MGSVACGATFSVGTAGGADTRAEGFVLGKGEVYSGSAVDHPSVQSAADLWNPLLVRSVVLDAIPGHGAWYHSHRHVTNDHSAVGWI